MPEADSLWAPDSSGTPTPHGAFHVCLETQDSAENSMGADPFLLHHRVKEKKVHLGAVSLHPTAHLEGADEGVWGRQDRDHWEEFPQPGFVFLRTSREMNSSINVRE